MGAAEASVFLGNLERLEASDKVGLPFEFADEVYGRAARGEDLELPLIFEIKTQQGLKTHCAIYDFMMGLPENLVLLPKWVMDGIFLTEREVVSVRSVRLPLITYVKIQPHSADFYPAVTESGEDAKTLLTRSLSRFSALTEDS